MYQELKAALIAVMCSTKLPKWLQFADQSQPPPYRGFPKPTHFWGVSVIVLKFRYDLVLIRKRLRCKFELERMLRYAHSKMLKL